MLSHIILFPILAGLISQLSKFFIKSNKYEFDLKHLMAYSGMPSTHSAIVASLAAIVGLEDGWNSSIFALSFVLAIIVVRDALGIRRYLGEHSHVINILIKELKDDDLILKKYPRLVEKIGHTPAQVITGSVLGLAVSFIGYLVAG